MVKATNKRNNKQKPVANKGGKSFKQKGSQIQKKKDFKLQPKVAMSGTSFNQKKNNNSISNTNNQESDLIKSQKNRKKKKVNKVLFTEVEFSDHEEDVKGIQFGKSKFSMKSKVHNNTDTISLQENIIEDSIKISRDNFIVKPTEIVKNKKQKKSKRNKQKVAFQKKDKEDENIENKPVNVIKQTEKQDKTVITTSPSQKRKRKISNSATSAEHTIKYEEFNFEKADEEIMKIKKKKLDDDFKHVDNENTLFTEIEKNLKKNQLHKPEVNNNKTQTNKNVNNVKSKKSNEKENTGNSSNNPHNSQSNTTAKLKTKDIAKNEGASSNQKTKSKKKARNKNKNNSTESNELNHVKSQDAIELHERKELSSRPKISSHEMNKKKEIGKMLSRNKIVVREKSVQLRKAMMERLKAAQFRFLNEKLYKSSGSEAQQLFQSNPDAFQEYHEGFQQQVKKWPVNPLDIIIKRIRSMPKSFIIADMGCGEAALSRSVPHTVHSFDLVARAPGVRACDMARTPLGKQTVDVAVYCLALMGTELTKVLVEANRVLKMGGQLLIAEVESRFDDVNTFIDQVQSLGFRFSGSDKGYNVFVFLRFVKQRNPKGKLPELSLKPCLYKKR